MFARVQNAHAVKPEYEKRDQRPEYRAGVVCGGVESVGESPRLRGRRVGQQRVARRGADSLTDAIGDANRQHLWRGSRRGSERAHDRSNEIAGDDERLSAGDFVGPPSAQQLEQRCRGLGRPFDGADETCVRSENSRQENRQQRIDHLGRDVGEEAHRAQTDDVASELAQQPWLCHRLYDARTSEWSPTVISPFTPSTTVSSPTSEFLRTDFEIFALAPTIE